MDTVRARRGGMGRYLGREETAETGGGKVLSELLQEPGFERSAADQLVSALITPISSSSSKPARARAPLYAMECSGEDLKSS